MHEMKRLPLAIHTPNCTRSSTYNNLYSSQSNMWAQSPSRTYVQVCGRLQGRGEKVNGTKDAFPVQL